MGVTIDVWRQRIGRFKMPSSKASRTAAHIEVVFPGGELHVGIGGTTFLAIIVSVALVVSLMSARFDQLATCGDIESNPGPETSLLHKDLLQKLQHGEPVAAIPDGILYKHVLQLNNLRKEIGATWNTVVVWLKCLLPEFPSDGEHWPRNIQHQWGKNILERRCKHLKARTTHPERLSEWEETPYTLPTVKGPRPKKSTMEVPMTKYEADLLTEANEKLTHERDELEQEVKELKLRPSPHKQLLNKRREDSHKNIISDTRSKLRTLTKDQTKLDDKIVSVTETKRKLSSDFKNVTAKHKRLENKQEKGNEAYVFRLEDENVELTQKVTDLEEELKQCKEVNAVLLDAAITWRKKLAEAEQEELTLMEKGCFTSNTRKCVYELLGSHVAQDKIPKVIETVMDLAGKKVDHVPSASSVRNMNREMVVVSQMQLETLNNSNNLSLQSDETPKFGECYESFITDDDDGNSYLLGMRHMADKSAQTCLDTLKDILNDINDTCLSMGKNHVGYKILAKISSTMSDRAKTEAKFHRLVDTYRREILPQYHDQWDTLSEDAKSNLQNLYQFFCGLHLMVGMADVVNATLSKFEKLHHDTVEGLDDAETEDDKKLSESIIVRCVRTICKALSRGGDPKSGKHREWRVHCSSIGHSEYVSMLQTFKGNRFNIIFLLGGNLFFLHEEITKCLMEVPEPKNKLIRVCINLIKNKVNIAGCKALGILRKFLMMPLWRVTEEKGHILDMNQHYHKITNFIDTCTGEENTNNMLKFMRGEYFPLNSRLIEHDNVLNSLVTPDENDILVCGMLQSCFIALNIYLKKTVAEHLPGGEYWDSNPEVREATASAPRHNKNPERVFGLLDFLCRHRPNSTTMSNEAILMFIYNHTSAFLNSKSQTELDALISSVKLRTPEIVKQYKEREKVILQAHLEQKQIRANQEQQRRTNVLKKKTELTDLIVNEGLWQTTEYVDERLSREDLSEAQRRKALSWQLQFRRDVLGQYYKDSKVYTLSKKIGNKQVLKSSEELKNQLLTLINDAASVEGTSVMRSNKEKDKCTLLTGKCVKHRFSDGLDYVGKVIGPVPGFPEWFNITYENDDHVHVYTYRLLDDMKGGNLTIIVDV